MPVIFVNAYFPSPFNRRSLPLINPPISDRQLLGTAAAQTPPDQATPDRTEERGDAKAARSAPVKIIGSPTLVPAQPVRIFPPLKKMENK